MLDFGLWRLDFGLCLIGPAVMTYQRDEGTCAVVFSFVALLRFDDANQPLRFTRVADGDNEAASELQLREQGFGNFGAACGN